MSIFNQLADVIEWEQYNDETLFWKWTNREIKKGSVLIVRPGQDAVVLYNGKTEGIFRDEGRFDVESQIIPFLSTLKGFKFGFNSGLRAEVLFINTKELTVKWGTKNAVILPAEGLPGGMPIRAFGTFSCRVADEQILIDKVAGIQSSFTINDVKTRVMSNLDQLLMKWISQEGKDMFHLQSYAQEIANGIASDLDFEMHKIGIGITNFAISSVSYPEEVQAMLEKAASQSMIGDVGKYQQIAMADALSSGGSGAAGSAAATMAGLGAGMAMAQQMAGQMGAGKAGVNPAASGSAQAGIPAAGAYPTDAGQAPAGGVNFCPNCGQPANGARFCPNCGTKLIP